MRRTRRRQTRHRRTRRRRQWREPSRRGQELRNSTCGVRQRAWVSYCLTRERQGRGRLTRQPSRRQAGAGANLPANSRRSVVMDILVARAWSWLLWRALSLKRKSMAPCLWAVASAVAWVCSSGAGGAMASHASGGDAKAGSVPGQGQAHLKNRNGRGNGRCGVGI